MEDSDEVAIQYLKRCVTISAATQDQQESQRGKSEQDSSWFRDRSGGNIKDRAVVARIGDAAGAGEVFCYHRAADLAGRGNIGIRSENESLELFGIQIDGFCFVEIPNHFVIVIVPAVAEVSVIEARGNAADVDQKIRGIVSDQIDLLDLGVSEKIRSRDIENGQAI